MPSDDTTTGTTGQASGTSTAPATTPGTGQAPAPVTGTAQGQASHGKPTEPGSNPLEAELAAAQARIRDLEQANMTESQRKDARLAELEAERTTWQVERQTMTLRNAVLAEAMKAGAVYPDLVVNAVSPASVKWGKDGTPENVAQVVADARQAYPALFRVAPGSADGGAGQGVPSGQPTMNDLIRRGAGRA